MRTQTIALALALPLISLTGTHHNLLERRNDLVSTAPVAPAKHALALRYRVHLVSEWPQLTGPSGCVDGGEETIDGRLEQTPDGGYTGTLHRVSRISFC